MDAGGRATQEQLPKDNLPLFTPDILARINQAVVEAGYALLGKKNCPAPVAGRCDSFVVETDVHFPTDINLAYDAMRVLLCVCAQFSEAFGLKVWRHKKALRIIQKSETDDAFVAASKAHSAVESGINALDLTVLEYALTRVSMGAIKSAV